MLDNELIDQLEHHIHAYVVDSCRTRGVTEPFDQRLTNNYTKWLSITYQHLNPNGRIGNSYLLPALKSGKVKPSDVSQMDESEMNPSAWLCTQLKAT